MNCLWYALGFVALLFFGYLGWVGRGMRKHARRINEKLDPILSALRSGGEASSELIQAAAADPDVRNSLHQALVELGRAELFPAQYLTREAYAESDLAYWLSHPNELRQPPDEIEFMEVVSVESGTSLGPVDYLLFRYRTHPPHFSAGDGWLAGASGPYLSDPQGPLPEVSPGGTFSEFEQYDSKSHQDHVAGCHQCAVKVGAYERLQRNLT